MLVSSEKWKQSLRTLRQHFLHEPGMLFSQKDVCFFLRQLTPQCLHSETQGEQCFTDTTGNIQATAYPSPLKYSVARNIARLWRHHWKRCPPRSVSDEPFLRPDSLRRLRPRNRNCHRLCRCQTRSFLFLSHWQSLISWNEKMASQNNYMLQQFLSFFMNIRQVNKSPASEDEAIRETASAFEGPSPEF